MRTRRRALSPQQRRRLSAALVKTLSNSREFRASQRIACFFANDGEPDLSALIKHIWTTGRRCYMPVLNGVHHNRMLFAPYVPGGVTQNNRFGIPEPVTPKRKLINGRQLDLVLTPLVAFDMSGNRLGMGGGYYDRSFAFLHRRQRWLHPRLLGVAYQFQCVNHLPVEPWDVPLAGVTTQAALYRFNHHTKSITE